MGVRDSRVVASTNLFILQEESLYESSRPIAFSPPVGCCQPFSFPCYCSSSSGQQCHRRYVYAYEGAGHDYIKMLSETVNPANGSISLRIQWCLHRRRGISIPFSFSYDSNSVHHLIPWSVYGQVIWTSNIGYLSQGGWNYSVPMASIGVSDQTAGTYPIFYTCVVSTNYMFSDASGGAARVRMGTKNPPSGENCPNPPVSTGGDLQVGASIGATVQNPNLTNPTVLPVTAQFIGSEPRAKAVRRTTDRVISWPIRLRT